MVSSLLMSPVEDADQSMASMVFNNKDFEYEIVDIKFYYHNGKKKKKVKKKKMRVYGGGAASS